MIYAKCKVQVAFDVGEEHNGKIATVLHKKQDGNIESFEAKIQNGKVTVEVTELSPFMIAVDKVKEEDNNSGKQEDTPKKENENSQKQEEVKNDQKDVTPKTGVIDMSLAAIAISLISLFGIVAIFKKD